MSTINLPDFNDMYQLVEQIKDLQIKQKRLENHLDTERAGITKKVVGDSKYYINGRPPAMNFIERTYLVTGLKKELIKTREDLATVVAELEKARNLLKLYHAFIEVWRTESANKRYSVT